MAKILSKFGEQQPVMVNYACGFNQSETGCNDLRVIVNHDCVTSVAFCDAIAQQISFLNRATR